MTAVIRTVSFPHDDLADVVELAEEYGGLSALFQAMYRALLDYRAEHGASPSRDELALVMNQAKAKEEERREALARLRRQRAEARATAAQVKIEKRAARKVLAAKEPEPKRHVPAPQRAEAVSFEDFVAEGADLLRRLPGDSTDAHLRRTAKAQGFEQTRFVLACRNAAGVKGQANLRAVPAPKERAVE